QQVGNTIAVHVANARDRSAEARWPRQSPRRVVARAEERSAAAEYVHGIGRLRADREIAVAVPVEIARSHCIAERRSVSLDAERAIGLRHRCRQTLDAASINVHLTRPAAGALERARRGD